MELMMIMKVKMRSMMMVMLVTMRSLVMVTMDGVPFETCLFTVCWKFELLGSQEMIADVEVMLVACKKHHFRFVCSESYLKIV